MLMSKTHYQTSESSVKGYLPKYAKAQDNLDLREFWRILTRRKKTILSILGLSLLLALLLSLLSSPVYRATATLQVERENSQIFENGLLFNSDDIRDPRNFYDTQFELLKSYNLIERVVDKLQLNEDAIRHSLFGRLKNLLTPNSGTPEERKVALVHSVIDNLYIEPVRNSRLVAINMDAATPKQAAQIANTIVNSFVEMNLERRYQNSNQAQTVLQKSITDVKQKLEESEKRLAEYAREKNIINLDNKDNSSNSHAIMRLSEELVKAEREVILIETEAGHSAAELRTSKERAEKLRDILSREEQKALALQDSMITYNTLKREVETNQGMYQNLLQRLKEVDVAGEESNNNLVMVDEAQVPLQKFKPNIPTNLAFAGIFGLILGIAAAFLREFLDDRVNDINELEKQTHLPVIGLVPAAKDTEPRKLAQLALSSPKSPVAESFRSLATTLRFKLKEQGKTGILFITSARANEGKTTVAMNMANTFAQAGKHVLLIDADLRNPSLHQLLGAKTQEGGLAAYLTNQTSIEGLIQASTVPNLDIILAGKPPQTPAEILASPKMEVLLQVAIQHHDLVIIDGPPILGLADSMILASLADMTILVVEAGKTRLPTVNNSIKRLWDAGANVSGILLNRVTDPSRLGYGNDYYHYPSRS